MTFASDLVAWYKANHRPMPWRDTRDPYAIWVSEIMLQQTQVKTVIDYYHRFLARYPDIDSLANADIDDVLKLWEGLGYYTRGRNLHAAAKKIADLHGGRFPETLEEVVALPGIGRSTAGAILTFGSAQRHPLLDGNVKRVLSRIADIAEPVEKPATIETMWMLSTELLAESEEPYYYNQAIMELGATLCLPKVPRCLICPVKAHCVASQKGTQMERPVKGVKKAPLPHLQIGVGVVWHKDKVLIQQRPNEGLLGGLWEFPGGKQEAGETIEETVTRELREELSIQVVLKDKIKVVKHTYTHLKITMHAYHCDWLSGEPIPAYEQKWKWVLPNDLPLYAFPKANKTVLEAILIEWNEGKKSVELPV